MTAAGTVVAKNYLPFARVLADSFRRHHPEIPFFVLLVDEVDGCFTPEAEPFRVLTPADAGIPSYRALQFRYARRELAIVAKPWLLGCLLDRGYGSAVFLDADMLVLDGLTPFLEQARRHALALTPHFVTPATGERRIARELNVLQAGVYNGGLVGISGAPEARRFLSWWQNRVVGHCTHDLARGIHYDQRWLDLAPSFVEDLAVVRDPGCDAAYWNLPEREIRLEGNAVLAGGRPCRLFHFSGFNPDRAEVVSQFSPGLTMAEIGGAAEIFRRYLALLQQAGYECAKNWPYGSNRFDNGAPITPLMRQLYREMGTQAERFGDPFRTGDPGSYFCWLNSPAGGHPDPRKAVTRLWLAIYEQRPDVQRAFPAIFGADRRRFLRWTVRCGAREHGLSEHFLGGVH